MTLRSGYPTVGLTPRRACSLFYHLRLFFTKILDLKGQRYCQIGGCKTSAEKSHQLIFI